MRAAARVGMVDMAYRSGNDDARRGHHKVLAMVAADGSQRPRVCRGEPSPQILAGAALGMGEPSRMDMGRSASAGMCGHGSVVRMAGVYRVAHLSSATVAQGRAPTKNIAQPIPVRFLRIARTVSGKPWTDEIFA